ncbi:MAG: SMP-30/gluconolactonase/LRE family protein [Planctomycetia bacterium]|nr:SMP-30/gluconolactonase/LRE family protein [Planctomycetia bacterium]
MNRAVLLPVVIGMISLAAFAQEKPSANWDAPLCKPVDREAVYEFAREPAVKKIGPDRYEISFAVKGKCDVAVAVEGPDGRIVRHIGYGVLGANAPAPFKKDSLEQSIAWDGKDEFGKYVANAAQCRVRVSLGLHPTFDKLIGWHPKDTSSARHVAAIVADADGVYVLECLSYGAPQLRKFDHDTNYVRTIYPWAPDQLDKISIPKRTLPDAKIWRDGQVPPGSKASPHLVGYGATAPFGSVQDSTCLAVGAGKLGCFTVGGIHDIRRLLRLRTDGTTGGEPIEGGRFTEKAGSFKGQGHIALSPDGKWVYVTGQGRAGGVSAPPRRDMRLERPPYTWNAVFRFAWEETGLVVEGKDSFVGEVSRDAKVAGAGDDNNHLSLPQGLACDAVGRLYVADLGNHRIQVFSPEGKHLKTIPVKNPQEIAIHPQSGSIYALCFSRNEHGGADDKSSVTLIKFGPLDNPAEQLRQDFPVVIPGDPRVVGYPVPLLAVDGWAKETRVWLVHESGVVRVYAERGSKWELFDDFEADVRKAGHTPHAMNGGHMGYIAVDPLRGHVYSGRGNLRRIDPEEGKTWQRMDLSQLPQSKWASSSLEEVAFSWDGLMHARSLQFIARFNPDKFVTRAPSSGGKGSGEGAIPLNAACEVPFDYGDERGGTDRKGERESQLKGVISMPWAIGGPNGYNNGIGISPRGEVVALIENFQDFEIFRQPSASNPTGYFDSGQFKALLKDNEDRFRPGQFPGRAWSHGNLVWRFSRTGQVIGLDAIPGLPYSSFGIRSDATGNVFCGVGYHMNVDGKAHIGGSLAKFAPKGGRLIRDFGTPVKLDNPPNRPADFLTTGGGKIWGQNMFWCAPGMDQLHFVDGAGAGYPCECYHCKFDTDLYGRSFLPRAYGYHVAVLDTNGNRICTIGRFGTADKPAMKPGDTDIGLGQCSYLATVSDKWLYIADDSNLRIIRVKLGYQAEQRVAIAP